MNMDEIRDRVVLVARVIIGKYSYMAVGREAEQVVVMASPRVKLNPRKVPNK